MTKKARIVPQEYRFSFSTDHIPACSYLGDVNIRAQVATYSLTSSPETHLYSDADLRLLVARLEVAKEQAVENIDRHIALLQALLTQG